MSRPKVLVFDDTELHRQSAKLLLEKDYDLTVVGTYDEAQEALLSKVDEDKRRAFFAEKFGDNDPYKSEGIEKEVRERRLDFYCEEAREKATAYPDFDIVLTDLLVPASRQAQGGEGTKFVGQEMPLGTTIALLALCAGIKKVAVVTDKNHHHHPSSAAFDCFGKCRAEGVKIICTNRVGITRIDEATGEVIDEEFLNSEEGKAKYPYSEDYRNRKGLIRGGKNWLEIINQLI